MSTTPMTAGSAAPEAEAARFQQQFAEAREAVGRVIVGQQRVVEAVLTAVFCGGNVLLGCRAWARPNSSRHSRGCLIWSFGGFSLPPI